MGSSKRSGACFDSNREVCEYIEQVRGVSASVTRVCCDSLALSVSLLSHFTVAVWVSRGICKFAARPVKNVAPARRTMRRLLSVWKQRNALFDEIAAAGGADRNIALSPKNS